MLEDTELAVLDHGLVQRINPWPQLGVELFARGTRRAHNLAVVLAIAHHQRTDERLLLTLSRISPSAGAGSGRRGSSSCCRSPTSASPDLIGAHRPSVTTAMGELVRAGQVSRRDDGAWVLHGTPPEKLRHHPLGAALT